MIKKILQRFLQRPVGVMLGVMAGFAFVATTLIAIGTLLGFSKDWGWFGTGREWFLTWMGLSVIWAVEDQIVERLRRIEKMLKELAADAPLPDVKQV